MKELTIAQINVLVYQADLNAENALALSKVIDEYISDFDTRLEGELAYEHADAVLGHLQEIRDKMKKDDDPNKH